MWVTHLLVSKLHLNPWVIENEDVHLIENRCTTIAEQEEEGIYVHDKLTESSLNKKLTMLGEMEDALILCNDFSTLHSLPSS